ncbi:MAG TPA: pitrilysin family protein [Vicinamibacterales bacterium]|nr:pitrilysin family protein [Vicinamibacterales bacterium]
MKTAKSLIQRALLGVLVAAVAVAVSAQEKPDRTKPPAIGPAPSLKMPAIQKQKLSNGLEVWLVEHHEVPLAQVNLIVRSGSAADPIGKYGIGSLTAAMLDEGAGKLSALDLADGLEFLGANLSTSSSFDYSAVRLSVPVSKLADALPLMADVSLRPTFPAAELDRLRQERLTGLLQARDNPAALIGMAFPRVIFGPTHRYGTSANGLPPTIEAFTVADLQTFYRAHYRPGNATLLVVGDVTLASAMPMLEKAFGSWKTDGMAPLVAEVPVAPQLTSRQVYIIDKPDAPQSQVRIGWVGVSRSTPDYAALEVLNTILGGSFTSRLNQNLREDKGYSYGASSVFDMRLSAGPFLAAAGVQSDKTAPSIQEFFNELNNILKPIPEEELKKAKNYVALGFPGEFETTGDLARKLEDLVVYKLPEDTYTKFVSSVTSITAADLQRLAARYIQPDKMAVVVVGDRKSIEGPIRLLNLGPVNFITIDELFR